MAHLEARGADETGREEGREEGGERERKGGREGGRGRTNESENEIDLESCAGKRCRFQCLARGRRAGVSRRKWQRAAATKWRQDSSVPSSTTSPLPLSLCVRAPLHSRCALTQQLSACARACACARLLSACTRTRTRTCTSTQGGVRESCLVAAAQVRGRAQRSRRMGAREAWRSARVRGPKHLAEHVRMRRQPQTHDMYAENLYCMRFPTVIHIYG